MVLAHTLTLGAGRGPPRRGAATGCRRRVSSQPVQVRTHTRTSFFCAARQPRDSSGRYGRPVRGVGNRTAALTGECRHSTKYVLACLFAVSLCTPPRFPRPKPDVVFYLRRDLGWVAASIQYLAWQEKKL